MKYLKYFKENNANVGWILTYPILSIPSMPSTCITKKNFDEIFDFRYNDDFVELWYNVDITLKIEKDLITIHISCGKVVYHIELTDNISELEEFKSLTKECEKTLNSVQYIEKILEKYDIIYYSKLIELLENNGVEDCSIIKLTMSEQINTIKELIKFNKKVDEVIEECDHLLTGKDMGLL